MKENSESKKKLPPLKDFNDKIFQERLSQKYQELYEYYKTIYHNDQMFDSLINMIFDFYQKRSESFKKLDMERLKDPKWFCKNDSIGIQIYTEKLAGTLRGLESKLDYLQKLGVKFVYALPFLDSPSGKSDGGFAISDYQKVRKELGTIEDLRHLISTLHDRNMCFCMNFVINHTSDEHEWAKRAKKGEIEYQTRYYFYDSWYIPNQYSNLRRFFGDIAPDNFTFIPECQKIVMTTFYPFQWDLNFTNPVVFNEIMANILFLMNTGVDVVFFNGTPCLWKKPGTSCRMLNQTYIINYLIFTIMQIVCPGVAAWIDLDQKKNKINKKNIKLKDNEINNNNDDDDDDESESENEFLVTESGVLVRDYDDDELTQMNTTKSSFIEDEEEEEVIEFDRSIEVGNIHYNYPWISRLWATLALNDIHAIKNSINSVCNRFPNKSFFTRVQSHDDINWGNGFDLESSSLIGKGLGNADGYHGDIICLYRYLNDFYTGNMPGSYSKGFLFAEDLVTGKSRICGRTASLLGLERAIDDRNSILTKIEKVKNRFNELKNKLKHSQNNIQNAIDQILLLHAVAASMPSMFIIYYGDEIGQLNDYSGSNYICNIKDTRFLLRGVFDWKVIDVIENDDDSYQARIFNGIRSINNARLNYKSFTDNKKTVFIDSYSYNQYYNDEIEDVSNEYEIDFSVLIFKRIQNDGKFLVFIFNFCKYPRLVNIKERSITGKFRDLISNQVFEQINCFKIKGFGYLWLEPIDD